MKWYSFMKSSIMEIISLYIVTFTVYSSVVFSVLLLYIHDLQSVCIVYFTIPPRFCIFFMKDSGYTDKK